MISTNAPPSDIDANTGMRRHDLDALRVIGMGVVILVHCARYFDKYSWHVENQTSVPFLTWFVNWAGQWVIPMFMLLAGMGARYALRRRDWKAFIQDRWRRLMVPFIFGVLVLSPPQIYLERLTHAQFDGSLWSFLPAYFDGWYGFGGNFAWMGLHLWFLLLLFLFAMGTLPILWRLRNKELWRYPTWVAALLALFLLVGSEILVNLYPDSLGRRNFGGWSPVTYLIIYLLGYGVASNLEIEHWIRRIWWTGFLIGISGSVFGFLKYGLWYEHYGLDSSIVRALASWGWIIGILGLATRWKGHSNDLIRKMSRAVLPIYVLHQPIIVGVGWVMIGSEFDWRLEYAIMVSVSLLLMTGAYLMIRKLSPIAPLFGISTMS